MNVYTSAHSVQGVKIGPLRALEGGGYYRELTIEGKDGTLEISLHSDSPGRLHVQAAEGPATPSQVRRFRATGRV